jgi:hypothetical protein
VNARTAAPGGTTLPPPDVRQSLERRLRRETQGSVLFDLASRGRYATEPGTRPAPYMRDPRYLSSSTCIVDEPRTRRILARSNSD